MEQAPYMVHLSMDESRGGEVAEKAQGRSGCRKTAIWTGVGCLALPVGLILFAAVSLLIGYTFYGREGPARNEKSLLTVPAGTGGGGARQPGDGAAGKETGPDAGILPGRDIEDLQTSLPRRPQAVTLNLDLEEGDFEIRPGPPGTDIQVEGFFDPHDYELTQEAEESGEGREITIRFRRKVPFLFHLLRGGFTEDGSHDKNRVLVQIPEDLPTALNLVLSRGESNIELGGLSLTALKADLSMGEHDVTVSRPVQEELERVDFHTGMGEIHLNQLGNIRARQITISGRMGELSADLGGEWAPGFTTRADLSFAMGECRISVPPGVRISPDSTTSIFLGESRDEATGEGQPQDPNAPTLEIHASSKMGELSIRRN